MHVPVMVEVHEPGWSLQMKAASLSSLTKCCLILAAVRNQALMALVAL
jgi:hypothetical protein